MGDAERLDEQQDGNEDFDSWEQVSFQDRSDDGEKYGNQISENLIKKIIIIRREPIDRSSERYIYIYIYL